MWTNLLFVNKVNLHVVQIWITKLSWKAYWWGNAIKIRSKSLFSTSPSITIASSSVALILFKTWTPNQMFIHFHTFWGFHVRSNFLSAHQLISWCFFSWSICDIDIHHSYVHESSDEHGVKTVDKSLWCQRTRFLLFILSGKSFLGL